MIRCWRYCLEISFRCPRMEFWLLKCALKCACAIPGEFHLSEAALICSVKGFLEISWSPFFVICYVSVRTKSHKQLYREQARVLTLLLDLQTFWDPRTTQLPRLTSPLSLTHPLHPPSSLKKQHDILVAVCTTVGLLDRLFTISSPPSTFSGDCKTRLSVFLAWSPEHL